MRKRFTKLLERFYGISHFYLVVWCKTPNCATVSPLHYLGGNSSVTVSLGSVGFNMTCNKCGKEWLYTVDDVEAVDLKRGPPEGWKDRI